MSLAYTIASLANEWCCSEGVIRKLIRDGKLGCFRPGTVRAQGTGIWGRSRRGEAMTTLPICEKLRTYDGNPGETAWEAAAIIEGLVEAARLFIHYDSTDEDEGVAMMLNYAAALEATKAALKAAGSTP